MTQPIMKKEVEHFLEEPANAPFCQPRAGIVPAALELQGRVLVGVGSGDFLRALWQLADLQYRDRPLRREVGSEATSAD